MNSTCLYGLHNLNTDLIQKHNTAEKEYMQANKAGIGGRLSPTIEKCLKFQKKNKDQYEKW